MTKKKDETDICLNHAGWLWGWWDRIYFSAGQKPTKYKNFHYCTFHYHNVEPAFTVHRKTLPHYWLYRFITHFNFSDSLKTDIKKTCMQTKHELCWPPVHVIHFGTVFLLFYKSFSFNIQTYHSSCSAILWLLLQQIWK